MTYRTVAGNLNNAYRWISRKCNALDSMPKKLLEKVESRFAFSSMVTSTGASMPISAPLLAISQDTFARTAREITLPSILKALSAAIKNIKSFEDYEKHARQIIALRRDEEIQNNNDAMMELIILFDKLQAPQPRQAAFQDELRNKTLSLREEYSLRRTIKNREWEAAYEVLSSENWPLEKEPLKKLLEGLPEQDFRRIIQTEASLEKLKKFFELITSLDSETLNSRLTKEQKYKALYLWENLILGRHSIAERDLILAYHLDSAYIKLQLLMMAEKKVLPSQDYSVSHDKNELSQILSFISTDTLKAILADATAVQLEGFMLAAIDTSSGLGKLYEASSLARLADAAYASERKSHLLFMNLAYLVRAQKTALDSLLAIREDLTVFVFGLAAIPIGKNSDFIQTFLLMDQTYFERAIHAALRKREFEHSAEPLRRMLLIATDKEADATLLKRIAAAIEKLGLEEEALAIIQKEKHLIQDAGAALLVEMNISMGV